MSFFAPKSLGYVFAEGRINSDGTAVLLAGSNVASVVRNVLGDFTVTTSSPLPSNAVVIVTCARNGTPWSVAATEIAAGRTSNSFRVTFCNAFVGAAAFIDPHEFSFVVYGR